MDFENIMNIKKLPDLLSVSRIVLSFIFAYLLYAVFSINRYALLTLVLFILIVLTDFFDGFIARHTGNTSSHGALLDVIADMIFVLLSYLTLSICGLVNYLFILVLIIKFLEFLSTSFLFKDKMDNEYLIFDFIGKNVSKFWIAFPGIIIIFYILDFTDLNDFIAIVCLVTSILALLSTVNRLLSYKD